MSPARPTAEQLSSWLNSCPLGQEQAYLYPAEMADLLLLLSNSAFDTEYPAVRDSTYSRRQRRHKDTSLNLQGSIGEIALRERGAIGCIAGIAKSEIIAGCHYKHFPEWLVDMLRYRLDGLSCSGIAEVMNCSETTVRRDIREAMEELETVPYFGLWSVLAEVFCVSAYRIKILLTVED
jgi:hypothetical protein